MCSRTRQFFIPSSGRIRLISIVAKFSIILTVYFGKAIKAQGISPYDSHGPTFAFDTQGPTFAIEPVSHLEFTNSAGNRIDCTARGNPTPTIDWVDGNNNAVSTIPQLRLVLQNGSLYFPPFEPVGFRQDVHWLIYRCIASSAVGTIVSRDVTVKAVVNQLYEPEVQNPGGFLGSNVLIKCNIPSFVKEYVRVTSWLQEPSFNIYPSLESDGKYHMLPSGELLIINITRSDAQRTYRCRTHHQLTQQAVVSGNVGRIQLTEMREPVPPIMNEKIVPLTVRVDDPIVVPCVAYASPSPTYRWHRRKVNLEDSLESLLATGRATIRYGTLIITSVKKSDSGSYFCTATNSEGSETLEVQISVIAPLSAHIVPARQTVDLGKPAELKCSVTGFPQQSFVWLKDGQPLRTGSRVRLLSKEHIKITSVIKEDKGMYQCFVKSDMDSAQGTAELRLGEVAPQLVYKFIEQTMQPGPGASLKCSATGNPTPQITWSLDGFPLPNNDRLLIGQYVTLYGDVVSHVNISAVKSEDGGEYECIARSRAGSALHSAKLNIYGLPYVRPMPAISAVAGKALTIKCPVAGYPIESIIWEKVPPKITPFSFARDLNVGDRTSIQCVVAKGDLPLSFTWLKDGQPISTHGTGGGGGGGGGGQSSGLSPDNHLQSGLDYTGNSAGGIITIRQNDDFTSALSINSVTRAQGGTYSCRVENDAATVTHSTQLRVNVPPRISPFSFEDGITEGMRTQLLCSSSQGDQPFNITWLRDSKPLHLTGMPERGDDSYININDYGPFSSILLIHNVTSRHNGNYTCQVTNRAGTVEYTALLSVAVPPRWVVEPQDQSAVLGNAVLIMCKADGFPVPTVHWKQAIGEQSGEYRELNYATGASGIESHSNGSLVIPKVFQEHEGYFLCQASNGIGAGLSKLIKLTVHVGPNVTVPVKQVSVRRGDRVTLRCEAAGDQPLDVSWRSKGNRIDPAYDIRYHLKNSPISKGVVSELTVVQTTLSDRGEYSCVASNAYGHDHAAVHLQVLEPPNFPRNLHVIELSSRAVTLAWSPNDQAAPGSYRDSQPITGYRLQYKEAQDVWHEHNTAISIQGERTTLHVGNLKPASSYHFRLYAENNLGSSGPSDILHVQTDCEVPSSPPLQVRGVALGSQELLITWRPPERKHWNGDLLGYTIGWRKNNSNDPWNYTKVGIPGGEGYNDFRLTGLEKFTNYSITVAAFNIKGDGPAGHEQTICTLEDVPSAPPQAVTCTAISAYGIHITWKPPPEENRHGIIRNYKVIYEPDLDMMEYSIRQSKIILDDLKTAVYNLTPWTNYSIQVVASTKAGDGAPSRAILCQTLESVPDAPERLKACSSGNSSAVISWMPPRRPNGIVKKYTVYVRVLEGGVEVEIRKFFIQDPMVTYISHYEVKKLVITNSYEAWVVAATSVGDGPTTPVVKLMPSPSNSVPAAIISFSQSIKVGQREDLRLPCLVVGNPQPAVDWKSSTKPKVAFRLEVDEIFTLVLRNVQRTHEGNYTCIARNTFGTDRVVYTIIVMVPPGPPTLIALTSSANTVSLHWNVTDDGSSTLIGFVLSYRQEFEDWDHITIDRHSRSHLLENLQCGTFYEFNIVAINKIGSSNPSPMIGTRTRGNKPTSPLKHNLVRPNVTSVLLEIANWQDGGCPIQYFTVEFRRYGLSSDWIVVSSNVPPQARYTISDLDPATAYSLRITAHNNAGSTIAEYYFETFDAVTRSVENIIEEDNTLPVVESIFSDTHLLGVVVIVTFALILTGVGVCFCVKSFPRLVFTRDSDVGPPQMIENKNQLNEQTEQQHREQFYATVRKPSSQQSPRDSEVGLERIPEYSEDIYPYATFHLPDHENQSGNPIRKGCMYNSRDSTLTSKGKRSEVCTPSSSLLGGVGGGANPVTSANCPVGVGGVGGGGGGGGGVGVTVPGGNISNSSNNGTEKRLRRKSKGAKSESEEYDSLNSDSDVSADRGVSSRTESSSHLEDSGPISFTSHGHSPGSRGNKERLTVFTRPSLHKNKYIIRESNISPEHLQTFEYHRQANDGMKNSPGYGGGGPKKQTGATPAVLTHRRTFSIGNHIVDMPVINYRDFDPPPKQHQQHQQQQHQQQQQQQQQHHHQQQQPKVASTSSPPSAATSPTTSATTATSVTKGDQFESKLSSTNTSQSNSYVEILKNSSYQNLSQKYAQIPVSGVTSSSSPSSGSVAITSLTRPNLNNSSQKLATAMASAKPIKNFLLNGPTLKMIEMHQTSSSLNKNYGDFLTITPRRKSRNMASNNIANPIPLNSSVVSCTSNTSYAERYQHRLHESSYNGIEPLNLLGIQPEYISSGSKNYDYRTMETLCNADTLKLGTDIYLRSKYSHIGGKVANSGKSSGGEYERDAEVGIVQNKNIETASSLQSEKLNSAIGYANVANVSPPSAFSDNDKQHTLLNLIRQTDKNAGSTIAPGKYGKNSGSDYTIAV